MRERVLACLKAQRLTQQPRTNSAETLHTPAPSVAHGKPECGGKHIRLGSSSVATNE